MDIIPDKKEFKREEVEGITNLSGNVLDYWEKKFNAFLPQIIRNEKVYKHKDVAVILKIKQYLTIDRLNDNEIKEKLSNKTDNKLPVIKEEKWKESEEKEIKKDDTIKKTEKTLFSNKENIHIKKKKDNIQKIITKINKKPKEINKKNNVHKLEQIKGELLDILTILENNDKNKD